MAIRWRNAINPFLIACRNSNLKIVQMLIEHDRGKSVRSTGFFIAFEQGNELSMISRSDLRNCVHDDRTAFDCLISQGYIQLAEHLELNSLALEIDILKCRCAQLIVSKRITYQQCLLPRFFFISMRKIF